MNSETIAYRGACQDCPPFKPPVHRLRLAPSRPLAVADGIACACAPVSVTARRPRAPCIGRHTDCMPKLLEEAGWVMRELRRMPRNPPDPVERQGHNG